MISSHAIKVAMAALLVTCAPSAAAQSCIGIAEAASLAATQDPRIAGARARVSLAEAGFRDALALRRPQISAFTRTSAGDGGLTSSQIENQVGVEVSQRLFDFGDARLARQAARNDVSASKYALQAEQIATGAQAARAVLAYGEATAVATLIEERIAYFSDLADRLERLLVLGGATSDALAAVRSRLAAARAERAETEIALSRAQTDLAIITGRDAAPCSEVGESEVLALALFEDARGTEANPEIESLRREIDAAEAQLRRERRARLPAVDVVAIGSYVYDGFRDEWALRDRVGIDVTVPIYQGDTLRARSQRAAATLALRESELSAVSRRTEQELQSAVRQIRALRGLRDSRADAAEQKADELDAVEIAFRGGQRTLFELLETRIGLSDARRALISVEFGLYREYLWLAELTGALAVPLDPVEEPQARQIWGWEPDPRN